MALLRYAAKRVVFMLLTLFAITFLCFILVRMLPPAELPLNDPHTAVIEARREAQGYNKPYLVQFGIFLRNVLTRWDWGVSDKLYLGQDVTAIFAEKLPATVIVNLYSILISVPTGILLGILAALRKNSVTDHVISTLTMVSISVPSFVYAFLIQYLLSYRLGWLPFLMKAGRDWFSPEMTRSMLPAVLSLSLGVIAGFTRTTRAELCEVLTGDFMLLARAKGLGRMQAAIRHGLKNCMVVVLPAIFGSVVGILGGSFIIEKIFAVPGVGSLYINAINGRDYPMFMLLTVFYTAVGLAASIIVDISCGIVDPRIRMGGK
ncbi:MAG: ABC transporter permease [Ruminococcaceae bacterium]|nr:ABC transporter permease [Oscillospiraceae bacterium]